MKRLIFCLFFILLHLGFSHAQTPTLQWQKCIGGSQRDYGYSISQTLDSGYIIAGSTESTDGDADGLGAWIVKMCSGGSIQWRRSYTGGAAHAISIKQTTDGGYIFTGDAYANGDASEVHGNGDVWVVKINQYSGIEWQKCLGGSDMDGGEDIIQTPDGGYVVAAQTQSYDGDVSGLHNPTGHLFDNWIVKLNNTGNIQWQKCLGGSERDECSKIIQTTDGGYLVTGYTESNNGDVTSNHGNGDMWVVKLSGSGSTEWQRTYGGSKYDEGYAAIKTTEGGYLLLAGTSSSDGDVSGNHSTVVDIWLVKINDTGVIQWQKCIGGSLGDVGRDIIKVNGGYIIGAGTASNDGNVSGCHGNADYWLVKVDDTGKVLWQKCAGGSDNDLETSMAATYDGGFIMAGFTFSNDGDVSGYHGNTDMWVAKLRDPALPAVPVSQPCFPMSINDAAPAQRVTISPNPVSDVLHIQGADAAGITICNTLGQQVLSAQHITQLTVSSLPAGIYFIRLHDDHGQLLYTGKVVKE